MTGIENSLGAVWRKRGISAARLAELVGISRQTIHAIEAGTYVPNTAVSLLLARALDVTIEELFALAGAAAVLPRTESASLLPGSGTPETGRPVELCRVDKRLIGSMPSPVAWYLPLADGVVVEAGARVKVQRFRVDDDLGNRILVAGCDPGISVLARHAQRAGVELVVAHRNSSQALELLKQGCIHIAGTHLRDESTGESNLPAIRRMFARGAVAAVSFAVWEEGLVIARGNPKSIRNVEDLAGKNVRMVNREAGAGSRMLLDACLHRAGLDAKRVRGYNQVADGHVAAAWQVHAGQADCCVATRAAARVLGLDFIPLVSERYDLVVRRKHLDSPGVQRLLDALAQAAFRRELAAAGGYDTSVTGQRLI